MSLAIGIIPGVEIAAAPAVAAAPAAAAAAAAALAAPIAAIPKGTRGQWPY